ncbi:MAG: hypothetical protein ABI763_00750 [Bacteroidota bacterium]
MSNDGCPVDRNDSMTPAYQQAGIDGCLGFINDGCSGYPCDGCLVVLLMTSYSAERPSVLA